MTSTPRTFQDDELLIATHNAGKVKEFHLIFGDTVRIVSSGELGLAEPEETEATFAGNAALKALAAARASGRVALADDSGLAVEALGGDPGVYSARWAGPERDFLKAMTQVHDRLGDSENRSAAFVAVLALAWPDGHVEIAEGRVSGQIVWPPRGERGFGYDPIFVPDGESRTFGEMAPEEKKAMSHRGMAVKALIARCFPRLAGYGAS